VQQRVEAARTPEGVDARSSGLEVGAELGEPPDALRVVGVPMKMSCSNPVLVTVRSVGGHAPPANGVRVA